MTWQVPQKSPSVPCASLDPLFGENTITSPANLKHRVLFSESYGYGRSLIPPTPNPGAACARPPVFRSLRSGQAAEAPSGWAMGWGEGSAPKRHLDWTSWEQTQEPLAPKKEVYKYSVNLGGKKTRKRLHVWRDAFEVESGRMRHS